MTHTQRFFLALLALVFAAGTACAQVTTGTPPFGSFARGPDILNLGNLNSHLDISVLNKAGRGMNLLYDIGYDSSVWYPVTSNGTTSWQPVTNWGWQIQAPTGYVTFQVTILDCVDRNGNPTGETDQYSNWAYHDPFGATHTFSGTSRELIWGTCLSTRDLNVTTSDGSGYKLTTVGGGGASYTVYDRLGTVINDSNSPGGGGSLTDRNGNVLSLSSSGVYTDTLGTTALTVSGSGTVSSPIKLTYTAPSGAAPFYQINYTNYTVATNFGVSGISEYKSGAAVPLPTSIALPDGSQYSFGYEATPGTCTPYAGTTCVTARLASVTLPTGGSITYTYTGGNNGIFSDGSTAGLSRVLSDGAGWSATWTYARSQISGSHWRTTITDPTTPTANQTVIDFQGIYETERKVYQGSTSGTLLQTIDTCYNGAASPCTGTAVALPITRRTKLIALPDNSGKVCEHDQFFNSYGLQTEQDDYDYGSGAPSTALLRKVITVYNTTLTNNIVGMPTSITTCNGTGTSSSCTGPSGSSTGTVVGQTTFAYDETTPATTSGTPQHVSITGSRGNATTIKKLVQGTSTFLTTTVSYFDTGNPQTITDVNGAQGTYTYGACGNSFPTSVSEPLSLSKSMTWNCTGGVQLTSVDENNQTTTTAYTDPYFWRPASVTDPTSAVTNFSYATSAPYTWVESTMNFNGSTSTMDTRTTVDGLGRTHVQQKKQSQSATNYDSVETDYDSVGRINRVTLPYSGTAGQTSSTAPGTTTTYDALSRPSTVTDAGNGSVSYTYSQNDVYISVGPAPTGENPKRRQFEYNALGQLSSVCEVTSLSGNGTCAQSSSQTGYWTKYTLDPLGRLTGVTQNAQSASPQTRTYAYDLSGRLTSETNPESGTTAYTYDTDATCGTSNGDLVKKVDGVGNVTCSAYDALHRPTAVTYPSGSYASVTPAKHFVYDGATVNNVAMTAVKGRLAEAHTCTGACSSKITDEGFSYTPRGELSDVYESTPHSGSYYHVSAQYWANSALKQLTAPGIPTITYSVDGEGRPYQVSASSGQNPVTNTVFNTAGLPTSVTYGSADSDSFTFDSNTNRITQYKFTVGSSPQSLVGNLTWNANATLASQNITDPFNSADTQNCSYTHDDLTRIAGANCGSAANQTFSYDAFGNISKSGSPYSFQPTYNSGTNRMTSIGGSTPTYDANGNVTNDFLHSYAWDSAGRPVTIDTVSATYDALGRMVEQNRSGSYTQIVYCPGGAKLSLMNGQTLQKSFVPLPGGGQAVYNSSGLLYYGHSDHLGSIKFGSTPSRTMYFDLAYAPFSEIYATSGSTDPDFTSQRQDTVANLYDFPAREYGIQGRWPSPDPSGLSSVHLSDPQTLNRYAYVRNSPLNLVDPMGLADVCPPATQGQCGAFWAGGGGGGADDTSLCNLDGGELPCDLLGGLGTSESAVQCPNNACWGVDNNGNFCTFAAGAGGASGCLTNQQRAEGIYEWGGQFYTSSQWSTFLENQVELQKEALADAISLASDSPDGSNWDRIYENLKYLGTVGGNANFAWTGNPSYISFIPGWNTGGCEVTCRYGSVPSIHNPGTNYDGNPVLHLDSANPLWGFGAGAFLHLLVDLGIGRLNSTVPLSPW